MAENNPSIDNSRQINTLSRRNFLKKGAALVGGAALLSQIPEIRIQTAEEKLHQLKERIGNRELTFQDASNCLPILAEIFASHYSFNLNAKQLQETTFFAHADPQAYQNFQAKDRENIISNSPDRDKLISPFIFQFEKDYPNHLLNGGTRSTLQSLGLGLTGNEGVFVSLNSVNHSGPQYQGENLFWNIEADAIEVTNDCHFTTPFASLVNTVFHEWVHHQVKNTPDRQLESEIIKAKNKFAEQFDKQKITYTKGFKAGLRAGIFSDNPAQGFDNLNGFEEFTASYLAAKLLTEIGLPFVAGGRNDTVPKSLKNFEIVLAQAGISATDLVNYQKNSQVEEVIKKLAEGAKNTHFNNDDEKIDLGFKLFKAFNVGINFFEPDNYRWEIQLKPYYPDIMLPAETEKVIFPGIKKRDDIGCANIKELMPKAA